jgi:hypothetical protein
MGHLGHPYPMPKQFKDVEEKERERYSFNFFGSKSSYAAKDGMLDTVVTIKKEHNSIRLNARKNFHKVLRVRNR